MSLYVGLMSGTSMDAVDAALVEFGSDKAKIIDYRQTALPQPIRRALSDLRQPASRCSLEEFGRLDIRIGRLFAEATQTLLKENNQRGDTIVAIGSHGQTVYHQPVSPDAFSIQIGDPNTIAALTGITTVADFRRMDIALGGQGAPLAPGFHEAQFRTPSCTRVIVNIGGIANITILPASEKQAVQGFDTGPGNGLLDDWASTHIGQPMDKGGRWGKTGSVDDQLFQEMLTDPYFKTLPPKSTGREYFDLTWLKDRLKGTATNPNPEDVQATLVKLTTATISSAIHAHAKDSKEVFVCGGGAHNPELMRQLSGTLGTRSVASTAALGYHPDCIEAAAFAWLAKCRIQGRPGNIPSVTGAHKPAILGAVYTPN